MGASDPCRYREAAASPRREGMRVPHRSSEASRAIRREGRLDVLFLNLDLERAARGGG
jgi:hypothetical protein